MGSVNDTTKVILSHDTQGTITFNKQLKTPNIRFFPLMCHAFTKVPAEPQLAQIVIMTNYGSQGPRDRDDSVMNVLEIGRPGQQAHDLEGRGCYWCCSTATYYQKGCTCASPVGSSTVGKSGGIRLEICKTGKKTIDKRKSVAAVTSGFAVHGDQLSSDA